MSPGGNIGLRIGSILALSLGPFLVMADIMSVMIVQKEIVLGFGAPGKVFPSVLGLIGIVLWFGGLFFLKWAKRVKKRKISGIATSVILKGRNGFRCHTCNEWIDASSIDYHERITCECGRNYDVFPEVTEEEGERSSQGPRSQTVKNRPVKRPPRQRIR